MDKHKPIKIKVWLEESFDYPHYWNYNYDFNIEGMMKIKDFKNQVWECIDEISFIPRKDIKSIFNCTDTTVAKMFNRDDFPAIMIGEHKVEKTALKK